MKSLEHPNIVAAMGVPVSIDVQDGELPLLAMEFCSGGDLRKVGWEIVASMFVSDVGIPEEFLRVQDFSSEVLHFDGWKVIYLLTLFSGLGN